MNVEWSSKARIDLHDIFDYILQENPAAAVKVLEAIEQATLKLSDHPGIGRPGRVENTRELVISGFPYTLPYCVEGDVVTVIRAMHTSRKWPD
ncbi:MAG: type II toxin-antitoxin system RelE/ParE family toxin [Sedimenticola sp.]